MSIVRGAKLSEKTLHNIADPHLSLGKYLTNACEDHPNAIFMVDAETEEYMTCGDVLEKSYKVAEWLSTLGCAPGSVVGIIIENSFAYPSLLLGISKLGAICTCINPLYSKNELEHAYHVSKMSIILTTTKLIDKVRYASVTCDFIKKIINIDEICLQDCDTDFKSEIDEINPTSSTPIILYSSGTTALSKGVMQSHKSWILIMELFKTENLIPFPENNVVSGFLPMSHTYGLFTLLLSMVLGHKYVLIKRYHENAFLDYIQKFEINTLYVVPSVAIFLANSVMIDGRDLSSVRLVASGGGFLRTENIEKIRRRFNCDFFSHCGMTETTVMTLYAVSNPKAGVTGRLVPGMMAKVVDVKTGEVLGSHKEGEYCLKGPLLFDGYMGVFSNDNIFDSEGWFHTGDVAYYDDDEDFYIVDRLKELIKYKGYQVPPAELEILILQHTGVKAVVVVGVPDEEVGELPRAYVVKEPESKITEDDILQYVAKNISPMKKLRGGVRFVDDLPRTSTGKIDRKEVKLWTQSPVNS